MPMLSEKELRDHFNMPLNEVAKKFGMCTTALKKLCRKYGVMQVRHRMSTPSSASPWHPKKPRPLACVCPLHYLPAPSFSPLRELGWCCSQDLICYVSSGRTGSCGAWRRRSHHCAQSNATPRTGAATWMRRSASLRCSARRWCREMVLTLTTRCPSLAPELVSPADASFSRERLQWWDDGVPCRIGAVMTLQSATLRTTSGAPTCSTATSFPQRRTSTSLRRRERLQNTRGPETAGMLEVRGG